MKTISIQTIQLFQKYFWMLLVCFSLSSCTVKDAFFGTFGLTIEKPLNKTKSTTSCQTTTIQEVQQTLVKIYQKSFNSLEFTFNNTSHQIAVYKSAVYDEIKNNGPPFYILFQRLKIAAVYDIF